MSDSESEDANLPSQEECLNRCVKFAEVTGTDNALAMFYLQDRDWDLQRSVSAYFETSGDAVVGASRSSDAKSTSDGASSTVKDTEPHRLRLLSWNIDGLDQKKLESRTKAVYELIKTENPHVVFLQEVIPLTEAMIEKNCPEYKLISSNVHKTHQYYNIILLKKENLNSFEGIEIFNFPNTTMGRHLLTVKATLKNVKFIFMTSHLESCKEYSTQRVEQMKKCLKQMTECDKTRTVIFGGDLNMRDHEYATIKDKAEDIYDIWEVTGKRPHAKFTWDMNRNDNLEFDGPFKPKCRFDRLYIRASSEPVIKPVYFELVGLQRLHCCQRFPSDHWGILTHYDII